MEYMKGIFAAKNRIHNLDKSCLPLLDEVFFNIEKNRGLNAFITVLKDDAYARAYELDKKLSSGAKPGRLFGIPVSIKDNIALKDVTLTCASKMLEGFVSDRNAAVTEKLLKEDAIIVGKTNMDEFAMGDANIYSAYGRVKNPINPDHVTGGSSGGAACSVRSGQCLAALGTDTGGSVRQPAAFCGIVGSKPTYGSINGDGVMPMAPSFDQVGALTLNVEDNALINSVLSTDGIGFSAAEKIAAIKSSGDSAAAISFLRGKRIAVAKEYEREISNSEAGIAMEHSIELLKKSGAEIVPFSIPQLHAVVTIYRIMMSTEAANCLSLFDGVNYGMIGEGQNLAERARSARNSGFGEEVKRRLFRGTFFLENKEYYTSAEKTLSELCRKFDALFETVDAVIWPTFLTTAFTPGENVSTNPAIGLSDGLTMVANLTGRPALSVPCHISRNGLPLGLHFMGKHNKDDELFCLGGIFEYLLSLS